MRKLKFALLLLVAFASVGTLAFKEDLFLISKNLDIFAALYKEISINYVEETNPTETMQNGIDGMLSRLDPYTEYVPESEIENYRLKYVSTQYGGIGISTLIIDGKLFVNEILEDNPAQKAGIRPGDEIVKINDIAIDTKDRLAISQLLRGPKNSSVDLTIKREGTTINKKVNRDEILQPNVTYSGMIGDNIGYIRLAKFLENSGQEVRDALVNLNKSQPKGIVLDLRNNGGGILQEAVKIVNLFVEKNIIVVVQKGRNPAKTVTYKTLNAPISPNIPLIVLINGSSASASEIVAGALQDLDRAVIVGQRSYGKGLVQQTFNLPYNSLVKVTVAKYYTPSGRCIQALDYAHKKDDGTALKFADSLMRTYNTVGGRMVYDGNGVFPDVLVVNENTSPITLNIFSKASYFNFVNDYWKRNKVIAPAWTFTLTDADFTAFLNTLTPKQLEFNSGTERLIQELKDEATAENRLDDVSAELTSLKNKLTIAGKPALLRNKTQIKQLLEAQIASRYYFEKGKVQQGFQHDKDFAAAESLIKDPAKVAQILGGQNSYKVIGAPVKK